MKISEIMHGQPILMVMMAFIGFIFLVAILPTTECVGNVNDDIALRKIFVGQIPYGTRYRTLHKYFEQFGDVEQAIVVKGQNYGFVTMKQKDDAIKACREPNPIIGGRKANVHLAAEPRENTHLAESPNSFDPLPKVQESNSNPTIDDQRTKVNLAHLEKKSRSRGKQRIENDNIALRKIFIGRLSHRINNESLRKYFQKFGQVEKALVMREKNISKGYGFVTMKKPEDAENACSIPNPIIDGHEVDVNLASKPENNKHLAARLPKLETQHYAPQNLHLQNSANHLISHIHPGMTAVPPPLGYTATHFLPQNLHPPPGFAPPVLLHFQPSIPSMPYPSMGYATIQHDPQNLHWPTSVLSHFQPNIPQHHMNLPQFSSAVVNSQIQNNQNWNQEAKSSLLMDPAIIHAIEASNEPPPKTNVRIGQSSQTIARESDSTSHNLPSSSSLNMEDLAEEHSVDSKIDQHHQENINVGIGTMDMDKLTFEKNEAMKKFDSSTLHQNGELRASDKNNRDTSVSEPSSKLNGKKASWADMVEEDERKEKENYNEKQLNPSK